MKKYILSFLLLVLVSACSESSKENKNEAQNKAKLEKNKELKPKDVVIAEVTSKIKIEEDRVTVLEDKAKTEEKTIKNVPIKCLVELKMGAATYHATGDDMLLIDEKELTVSSLTRVSGKSGELMGKWEVESFKKDKVLYTFYLNCS